MRTKIVVLTLFSVFTFHAFSQTGKLNNFQISINVGIPGASIIVDDNNEMIADSTGSVSMFLSPGKHIVKALMDSFETVENTINVYKNNDIFIIRMQKKPLFELSKNLIVEKPGKSQLINPIHPNGSGIIENRFQKKILEKPPAVILPNESTRKNNIDVIKQVQLPTADGKEFSFIFEQAILPTKYENIFEKVKILGRDKEGNRVILEGLLYVSPAEPPRPPIYNTITEYHHYQWSPGGHTTTKQVMVSRGTPGSPAKPLFIMLGTTRLPSTIDWEKGKIVLISNYSLKSESYGGTNCSYIYGQFVIK